MNSSDEKAKRKVRRRKRRRGEMMPKLVQKENILDMFLRIFSSF
jgi:hypothetical protein